MAEFTKSVQQTTSASTPTTTNSAPNGQSDTSSYRLPGDVTMKHAAKLAIVEDRPIMMDYWVESINPTYQIVLAITEDKPLMMDYWVDSLEKTALIGVRDNNEKLLVKSESEYTSVIGKFYKSGQEFIILTENSIYIVSSDIPTKKIL